MGQEVNLAQEFLISGQYLLAKKEAAKKMFKQFPNTSPRIAASCFVDETISINDWPDWLLDSYFDAQREIVRSKS